MTNCERCSADQKRGVYQCPGCGVDHLEAALLQKDALAKKVSDLAQECGGLQADLEARDRLKHDLERQGREWQAAVNELCSCGGKGPDDPGVCVACKVYHRAKGNESQKRNDGPRKSGCYVNGFQVGHEWVKGDIYTKCRLCNSINMDV